MALKKRRKLDIGYDGVPEGVDLEPNQVDGLLGRDKDGVWFFAGLPETVAPGIEETLLDLGWYPGMDPGMEIVIVEEDDYGRRAYLVHHGDKISYRCMRRTWRGFCNRRTFGPCRRHRRVGDTTTIGPSEHVRLDIRKAEMPEGWTLVGVIPGSANTYFARNERTGHIRAVCMRRRGLNALVKAAESGKSTHPRCMMPPQRKDGRPYGACYKHRWGGKKKLAFQNRMDPKFQSLVYRAAATNPAVSKIQERIDTITRSWYFLVDCMVKRANVIEAGEEDRSTGIAAVLAAAQNVIEATKIQSGQQAKIFVATGRVWAQQAYSLRLTQVLLQACEEETLVSRERISKRMYKALTRRGLISDSKRLPAFSPVPVDKVSDDLQLQVEGVRARNLQELELLTALRETKREAEYVLLIDEMRERILSLHPLIRTLDDLLIEEVLAGSPYSTVINRINHMHNSAMRAQDALEKSLDLNMAQRDIDKITGGTVDAVMEAISEEPAINQQRILARFLEMKDEVELPTNAGGAVNIVMEAVKERVTR